MNRIVAIVSIVVALCALAGDQIEIKLRERLTELDQSAMHGRIDVDGGRSIDGGWDAGH